MVSQRKTEFSGPGNFAFNHNYPLRPRETSFLTGTAFLFPGSRVVPVRSILSRSGKLQIPSELYFPGTENNSPGRKRVHPPEDFRFPVRVALISMENGVILPGNAFSRRGKLSFHPEKVFLSGKWQGKNHPQTCIKPEK